MAINRNPDSPKVTKYFGTPDWRYLWDRRDTRGLLDLYKARLTDIGYVEQVELDRLVAHDPGGGGQRYYYLILVSKHEAAIRIWNWVLKQSEASGQARLDLGKLKRMTRRHCVPSPPVEKSSCRVFALPHAGFVVHAPLLEEKRCLGREALVPHRPCPI